MDTISEWLNGGLWDCNMDAFMAGSPDGENMGLQMGIRNGM